MHHARCTHTLVSYPGQLFINPGSVGQNRCGKRNLACYGVFIDGAFEHRQVRFDQAEWLAALNRVAPLRKHARFRQWLIDGLVQGFGIGRTEPWTSLARQGYS